jgi:hypothetical protein
MAIVEAMLTYRPHGIGAEATVPIGSTADVRVLRAVRDALVERAREEALLWRDVDPGLFAVRSAEFERLCRVLSIILPDEELKPDLRLVTRPDV